MAKKKRQNDGKGKDSILASVRQLTRLCGAVSSIPIDESRSNLVSLLRLLSRRIVGYSQASDDDQLQWLCDLEDTARLVREGCVSYVDYQSLESEEVHGIYEDIEDIYRSQCDLDEAYQGLLLSRSLVVAYQGQIKMEMSVVDEVLSFLSNLYSSEQDIKGAALRSQIAAWTTCFDTRPCFDNSLWEHAILDFELAVRTEPSVVRSTVSPPKLESYTAVKLEEYKCNNIASQAATMDIPDTLYNVVEDFLSCEVPRKDGPFVFVLFAVGQSGSGKTFACDKVEKLVTAANHLGRDVKVIRPALPLDTLGLTIGDTEDSLTRILIAALSHKKSVLILDDVEHMVGESLVGPSKQRIGAPSLEKPESHSLCRSRSTFLSLLDALNSHVCAGSRNSFKVLVVATASSPVHVPLGRADRAFFLQQPNESERREFIQKTFGLKADSEDLQDASAHSRLRDMELIVSSLVACTVGKSWSELAQYCRRSVTSYAAVRQIGGDVEAPLSMKETLDLLAVMKSHLESIEPESLRSSVASDFVYMTVLTAKDLLPEVGPKFEFPLFGEDADRARKDVESLIVSPLCHSKALDNILFDQSAPGDSFVCGGVLLVGDPGCGKTELAHYCARQAASLLPSVTLIDVVCTSLVHKEVGGSERSLQRLFASARAAAPCILLMDGIESIGAVRGKDNTTEGTMDRLLSTLLTELDGVNGSDIASATMAVIAITPNEKWIDPALRRPGRLAKTIRMGKPNYEARRMIAMKDLSSLPTAAGAKEGLASSHAPNSDLARRIARSTQGASGADVVAHCAEVRMSLIRQQVDADQP